MGRVAALAAALLIAAQLAAPAVAATPAYATKGRCAGHPRIDLRTPPGTCVALLADASNGLRFPRRVLEVAPGRFWLIDMGSWEPNRGRLLEFMLPPAPRGGPLVFTVLADKLDRPLGLVLGPDRRIYVGEAGRIWRTALGASGGPVYGETLLDGLPADGAHPLKELAFGEGGKLYVNVGSSSDACRDDAGALPVPCPDRQGDKPRAAVWVATLGGAGFTVQSFRPFARGLRNSLALAFVPGANVLLQGENSIDYREADAPAEELNMLRDGADYGWPYCVGARQAARGYEKRFDCAATEAPAALWPAHAAPLQMLAVPAAASNRFAGQVLVAWHGYRAGGHRVVGFDIDANGRPKGPPHEWIGGWAAASGVRPLGAPTGITIDSVGRLLVVEDRNRSLLMLTRDNSK